MKKYFIAVIAIVSALSLAGCKKEEPVAEVQEEVTEVSEVAEEPVPEEEISVEGQIQPVDLAPLQEDEFYELDIEVFAESLKIQEPNFRSLLSIDADKELTLEDWQEIKNLVFYSKYGETVYAYLSRTGKGPKIEEEPAMDPDTEQALNDFFGGYEVISPTREYIDSLSAKEFFEWVCYVYKRNNNGQMPVVVPEPEDFWYELGTIEAIDYWQYMPEEWDDATRERFGEEEVVTKKGCEPGAAFREKIIQSFIDLGIFD